MPDRNSVVYSPPYLALHKELKQSIGPRPPSSMLEATDGFGLDEDSLILDVGCGYGSHTVELAQRHGCRGVGVDPLDYMLEKAAGIVADSGVGDRVEFRQGTIEAIPASDDEFDLVWCRDTLTVIDDLSTALGECARVLKPRKPMLVLLSYATDLLHDDEAERLHAPLGHGSHSMDRVHVERVFAEAGFAVEHHEIIGTEWLEWREEEGGGQQPSVDLLKVARLQRDRDSFIASYGEDVYAAVLASCHWGVYSMLGKLESNLYVLRNAG